MSVLSVDPSVKIDFDVDTNEHTLTVYVGDVNVVFDYNIDHSDCEFIDCRFAKEKVAGDKRKFVEVQFDDGSSEKIDFESLGADMKVLAYQLLVNDCVMAEDKTMREHYNECRFDV